MAPSKRVSGCACFYIAAHAAAAAAITQWERCSCDHNPGGHTFQGFAGVKQVLFAAACCKAIQHFLVAAAVTLCNAFLNIGARMSLPPPTDQLAPQVVTIFQNCWWVCLLAFSCLVCHLFCGVSSRRALDYAASSSLQLTMVSACGGAPSRTVTRAHTQPRYGGTRGACVAGNYNFAYTQWDNFIASISIPAGWRVTLYDGPMFTGRSVVLTSSQSCLLLSGWSKAATSMRIGELLKHLWVLRPVVCGHAGRTCYLPTEADNALYPAQPQSPRA